MVGAEEEVGVCASIKVPNAMKTKARRSMGCRDNSRVDLMVCSLGLRRFLRFLGFQGEFRYLKKSRTGGREDGATGGSSGPEV